MIHIAKSVMPKAKILIGGPPETGKTWIANYLGEATASSGGEYHPTQGVRILEYESEGEHPQTGGALRAEVELWDCGGKKEFESCWPAFSKDASGVLLIYNPDKMEEHIPELERWYKYFVVQQKLDVSQCLLFAHHKPSTNFVAEEQPGGKLSKVHCVFTNLEEDPDRIREEFNKFLIGLLTSRRDRQDQEELGIVGSA